MTTLVRPRFLLFRPATRIPSTSRVSAFLRPATNPPFGRGIPVRAFSSTVQAHEDNAALQAPDYLSESELAVFEKLKKALEPTKLEVQDISGGCGSMYGLEIVSPKFKDMAIIKQHKMVNAILKDELKQWHGVQLKTRAA